MRPKPRSAASAASRCSTASPPHWPRIDRMGIVDRGSRDERHPRSQWPDKRNWPPRDRPPEPPPPRRLVGPPATYLLMAICIAVFAYGEATNTSRVLVEDYGYLPSRLGEGGWEGYLGLVSHMFLHGGWVHLIVNMIV